MHVLELVKQKITSTIAFLHFLKQLYVCLSHLICSLAFPIGLLVNRLCNDQVRQVQLVLKQFSNLLLYKAHGLGDVPFYQNCLECLVYHCTDKQTIVTPH